MIGIARGLAPEGKIPFCASFTAFATRRVYDQVTISVAYANTNVKIVGTAPGITAGPERRHAHVLPGPGDHARDAEHARLQPGDAYELRSVMRYMAASRQPIYMQLIRVKMPRLFDEAYAFDPRTARRLRAGGDVTAGRHRLHDALRAGRRARRSRPRGSRSTCCTTRP